MSKTLKVFMISDFVDQSGATITAVIIATSEEDAKHEFEKALKNEDISLTLEFDVPILYTVQTVKMHKPSVNVLSWGEPE